MANSGRDDNQSQFFFTLGPTQELQNKHTIFAKVCVTCKSDIMNQFVHNWFLQVTGNTVYNMLKLAEVDIGPNERPIDPHKIYKTKVCVPRQEV